MQLRRAVFGMLVGVIGGAGLISACATSTELGDDDDVNAPLEAGAGEDDAPKRDGSATPPRGSSSGSSSGRSSSSSSGDNESSSSGGSSGGGTSGMLPPGPAPGSACTTPNEEFVQGCGLCGRQTARCDVGDLTVTEYSDCTGEVTTNGCVPGTPPETDVACGFCGTQSRTCSNSCKWVASACTGQQPNTDPDVRCTAGATKTTNTGCTNPQQVRTWTCRDATAGDQRCTWSAPPSSECVTPPSFITAPAVNGTASRLILEALQTKRKRPTSGYSCPSTSVTTADRFGTLTEVRNTTAATIKINAEIDGSTDRMMATYNVSPSTDDQLKACVAVNDTCSGTPQSCVSSVSIPANGSIWILTADWGINADATDYTLTVKTVP